MPINFPRIRPSSRTFTPPRWPTNATRSQSGVTSTRLWGSKPSDATLALGYDNITDDRAARFLAVHHAAKGPTLELTLSPEVFTGMSAKLHAELAALATQGLRWFFPENDPPRISSVKPGISSVQVNLIGQLRMD